jgi:gliding motility associated protien GldN
VGSYAQTKKRRRKNRAATTTKPTPAPSVATSAVPLVDTTKNIAARPLKPFDRPLDGYYKKTNILSAKVTPYPSLRESDVAYAKRVWRIIDIREKMNQYLASPKQLLFSVLWDAIQSGELTAYSAKADPKNDPDGDAFYRPLSAGEARRALADSITQTTFDKDNNKIQSRVLPDLVPDSVVKFELKEDWLFDRQRSVFEPRIIGIAPMVKIQVGSIVQYQPAFWIYFPDARQVLAVKEVVSRANDNTGLSFDDVFMKRIFTSYIIKESNDKDEGISDYETGIDKLYEAQRIKKSLQDWELNLWQY